MRGCGGRVNRRSARRCSKARRWRPSRLPARRPNESMRHSLSPRTCSTTAAMPIAARSTTPRPRKPCASAASWGRATACPSPWRRRSSTVRRPTSCDWASSSARRESIRGVATKAGPRHAAAAIDASSVRRASPRPASKIRRESAPAGRYAPTPSHRPLVAARVGEGRPRWRRVALRRPAPTGKQVGRCRCRVASTRP